MLRVAPRSHGPDTEYMPGDSGELYNTGTRKFRAEFYTKDYPRNKGSNIREVAAKRRCTSKGGTESPGCAVTRTRLWQSARELEEDACASAD